MSIMANSRESYSHTWKVLIPVLLCPLQELKVVLHLALDKHFHGYRAIDAVFAEDV